MTAAPEIELNNGAHRPDNARRAFDAPLKARIYGKTPAQVILRWHVERGDIVFPKSVNPARIRENIDIFDFELTGEDVEAIRALNGDERTGPDPDTFAFMPS